jgi:ADP-ribose pyrophosphatase YjhB (NUDIX family)
MTKRVLPMVLRQTGPTSGRRTRVRVSLLLLNEGRVFLLKSVVQGEEMWLLPGGAVEWGESLADTARREGREELDVDVEVGDLVAVVDMTSPDGEYHAVEVVLRAESQQPPVAQKEEPNEGEIIEGEYSIAGRWFDAGELSVVNAFPARLIREFLPEYIGLGGNSRPIYLANDW